MKDSNWSISKTINLTPSTNSLSFIVKENKKGFKYAGCHLENYIFIIDPNFKHDSIP
jgi:hypothetical protein